MGDNSAIEWTDASWNPVTGCSKVSPGCAHCYAETVALRFWPTQYAPIALPVVGTWRDGEPASRPRAFTDVMCHEDRLDQPLRWKRPRRVFVNSMSDLFHEDVPDAFIDRVFAVMALAPQHTFQILTKRAERMRSYGLARLVRTTVERERLCDAIQLAMDDAPRGWTLTGAPYAWPLANVCLGVSVENLPQRDRIIHLNQTPAAVRFLSLEPLLEDLELNAAWVFYIDWLIAGGESGPKARPCDLAWIRKIVKLGHGTGKPVFVKQLGANPVGSCTPEGCSLAPHSMKFKDRKSGDPSEWPEDLRVREFPRVEVTA